MTTPPPRPALRRAADADQHPAEVVRSSNGAAAVAEGAEKAVPTAVPGPTRATKGKKGQKGKKSKKSKRGKQASGRTSRAALEAQVPSDLLDRLDQRAESMGHTRDDVLALIIRAWLDG